MKYRQIFELMKTFSDQDLDQDAVVYNNTAEKVSDFVLGIDWDTSDPVSRKQVCLDEVEKILPKGYPYLISKSPYTATKETEGTEQ